MVRFRDYQPTDRARIHELQRAQYMRWFGDSAHGVFADPDSVPPEFTIVCEDDGQLVAAVSARPLVEVGTVLDLGRLGARGDRLALVRLAMQGWARLAARLYKADVDEAVSVVGPHIRGWGNMLVKRFGWKPEPFAMYRFDIKGEFDELRK